MAILKPLLVVEDEPFDQDLLCLAFESAHVQHPIVLLDDGQAAIEYLRTQEPPCLLLTDLKMPRCNGFDLLSWLRDQDHLQALPAVVLSSSAHESDRERSLELGARAYFVKPSSFLDLVRLAQELDRTWITRHCEESLVPEA